MVIKSSNGDLASCIKKIMIAPVYSREKVFIPLIHHTPSHSPPAGSPDATEAKARMALGRFEPARDASTTPMAPH